MSATGEGEMGDGAPWLCQGVCNRRGLCGFTRKLYVIPAQEQSCPLEIMHSMGGVKQPVTTGYHAMVRRCDRRECMMVPAGTQTTRDALHPPRGYESDDSSLCRKPTGYTKTGEKEKDEQQCLSRPRWYETDTDYRRRGQYYRRSRRLFPNNYLASCNPFQIKYAPIDLLQNSTYDMMSQEIWSKFIQSQQTEATFLKKIVLWRYLFCAIRSKYGFGLYLVGSTLSGFGLESSDVDLCLAVRPHTKMESRAQAIMHLTSMLHMVKCFDPDAKLVHAKVPILKFRDIHLGLQVDMNCNNVIGVKNTSLLSSLSKVDWRVRPLVTVTKLWARAHNINDARQRTLSSYALTLMVISYLQCGVTPAILPGHIGKVWHNTSHQNRQCIGELFHGLLKYYAEFPWDTMAVSVRLGEPVRLNECRLAHAPKNDPHQWKLLCVEEPFDLTNTARSVYDRVEFERIVRTFRVSSERVSASRQLASAWPQ